MPKTRGVTLKEELYDEDDNLILIEADFTCYPRKKMKPNWGGLPDPPEPARAELDNFKVVEVVEGPEDMTTEDVNKEDLYEEHDDYLHEEALKFTKRPLKEV